MKRLLIVSDSITRKTGYSTVARNIIKHLLPTNKYKIAQLGLAHIPTPLDLDIEHYSQVKLHNNCCGRGPLIEHQSGDKIEYIMLDPFVPLHPNQSICKNAHNSDRDNYGYESVFFAITHFKPDIVVAINDIWGLYNITHLSCREKFKFIPYLAVDSECMFPSIPPVDPTIGLPPIDPIGTMILANHVVVFTDWARNVINKVPEVLGKQLKEPLRISVIPHGVDNSIWKPLPDRSKLKQELWNLGPDTFLIGSIARNQPRKRLDAVMQTLKILIDRFEKNKKFYAYFHCSLQDKLGWNLPWLAKYYGVEKRCIFNDKLQPGNGPSDEELNKILNSFDIQLLLTNSEGWCTYPDTMILTPNGSKRIDTLEIGDEVITHTGQIKNIDAVLTRDYDGEIVRISTVGNINSLPLTPNHNVLTLRTSNELAEEWVPAGELSEGTYVSLPTHNGLDDIVFSLDVKNYIDMSNKITESGLIYPCVKNQFGLSETKNSKYKGFPEFYTLDVEISRLIGYYLAEGCSDNRRIRFCINSSGDDRIRTLVTKLFPNTTIENYDRNRQTLVICDTILSELFKIFGKNAHDKHLPESIFTIYYNQNDLSKELLNGLFEGDGSFLESRCVLSYTTVSIILAEQIRLLLLKNNIYSKLYKANRGEYTIVIQGKDDINACSTFIDKCKKWNLNRDNKRTIKFNGKIWFKITDISYEHYSGIVYNLTVADDNSYIAEGIAVHNCLPALESCAAGIPMVITDYSAHADWGKDALVFAKVAAYEHESRTGFIKAIADVSHAAQQINLLSNSPKLWEEYSKKGLALAKKLDWVNVCTQWDKFFDTINISDLDPNRYNELKLDHKNLVIPSLPVDPTTEEFELLEL